MPIILPQVAAASLESLSVAINAALEHLQPATKMIVAKEAQAHFNIIKQYLDQPPIIATDDDGEALPPNDAAKPGIPFPPPAPPKE